jgi:ferredoxin-nitrate reductase
MQIFHLAESGSIRFLWIIATNPAVSLPELGRIRNILEKEDLFVVVSDAFLTETAALADVVLPAAIWSEKTGCATNVDRTVHLAEKVIDPPGEARSDLEMFIDYGRRMDFRDKDGAPLVKWTDSAGAFESWKACSQGRPCDYSAMTHERLHAGPIQWPCNERYPEGRERLYEDGVFNTSASFCETYGHDLATGAAITAEEYASRDPNGRAIIKGAEYQPPPEEPDDDYPFLLTTGRVTYHFHTRTKTGRSPKLSAAAPSVFVEMADVDARALGVTEDDLVEIRSRRGHVVAPVRLGGVEPGVVFIPFHYGDDGTDDEPSAANRLTLTGWDPVSKQPHFKYAAVAIKALGKRRDSSTTQPVDTGTVATSPPGRAEQREPTAVGGRDKAQPTRREP